LDADLPPLLSKDKTVVVNGTDRKRSPRMEKLTRCTAGTQTHTKPMLAKNRVNNGKSVLTLYLEEKNALYDSYRNTSQELLHNRQNQRILK
jgi:hypothetical protein